MREKTHNQFIYEYYSYSTNPIYIGVTKNPAARMMQHSVKSLWSPLWQHCTIKLIGTDRNRAEAIESSLIARKSPDFNLIDNRSKKAITDFQCTMPQACTLNLFFYKVAIFSDDKQMIHESQTPFAFDSGLVHSIFDHKSARYFHIERRAIPEFSDEVESARNAAKQSIIIRKAIAQSDRLSA